MTIGKRIAKKRKAQNITQTALAEAVGVTTAFISQIEGGSRNPSYGIMLKIAHELDASVESFLSDKSEHVEDPLDKLLFSVIPFMDADKKRKLVEYVFLLSGSKFYSELPFFTSPTEYAQFLIQHHKIKEMPVDVFFIAEKLGVKIIRSAIDDYEGILYKSSETPLIVLNPEGRHFEREKFTVAILLGHLVLPWHTRQVFHRLKEKKSLDHTDPFEIEARQFAGELLLPGLIVKKDFKKLTPSIEMFEKFAYEKYKCSMTALAHKYVEYYGERAVYITSDKAKFTRTYENAFPYKLVDGIKEGSFAHSFILDPPAKKEIRKGPVAGSTWFKDIPEGVMVLEESMLDPKFEITVSLLKLA